MSMIIVAAILGILVYLAIPVAYFFNIVLFALFYRTFSKTTDAE